MPRLPSSDDFSRRTPRGAQPIVDINLEQQSRADLQGASDIMQAGNQIGLLGAKLEQVRRAEERRLDELKADDAVNKLYEKQTELYYGEKGFTRLKGGEVISRPVLDDYSKLLETEIGGIEKNLSTSQQKALFKQKASQISSRFKADLMKHTFDESEKYEADVLKGTLNRYATQATGQFSSEQDIINAKQGIQNTIRGYMQVRRDEGSIDAAINDSLSEFNIQVIQARQSNGDVTGALNYYRENKEQISVDKRKAVEGILKVSETELVAQTFSDEVMSNNLPMGEALQQTRDKFKDNPDARKLAVADIKERYRERDSEQRGAEEAMLNPVRVALGDAQGQGKTITRGQRDGLLKDIRLQDPKAYLEASDLIDKHNDEVTRENREAQSRANGLVGGSADQNWLTIKYDMVNNPQIYKNQNLSETIFPLVKEGKLKASDAEQAIKIQQEMRSGNTDQFVSLTTASKYLDDKLNGSYIDGKKFSALSKEKQAEVERKARAALDPAIESYQKSSGTKAKPDEVKKIIDDLFLDKTFRSTLPFTSIKVGNPFKQTVLDTEGFTMRSIPPRMRMKIEEVLRNNGIEVTDETVLQYYNARPQ